MYLKNHENLRFREIFLTPVTDYTPLLQCRGLENLNLGLARGDPEPLKKITWLRRLWWTGNREALEELDGCLPDTREESPVFSSAGDGWREGPLYYTMRDTLGESCLIE